MAIEINNILQAGSAAEVYNTKDKKVQNIDNIVPASSDTVNISGGGLFIENLKNKINNADSISISKASDIQNSIKTGTYTDSSKIAGGILNFINTVV
jgi:anti-sigma28 factor (negative regulator of flagellin synthesis)